MKVILQKIWEEPAVFIGLLVSLGLLTMNLLGGEDWSIESIIEVLAPLISALGIRTQVESTHKKPEPAGTRLVKPEELP